MKSDNEYCAELLNELVSASRDLRTFLVSLEDYLDTTARRIAAGEAVFDEMVADPTPRLMRDAFYDKTKTADEAMTRLRAEGTRRLVDEQGVTLTKMAAVTQRSRQFTTRLYRAGLARRDEAMGDSDLSGGR
jgi:hypothetical protein